MHTIQRGIVWALVVGFAAAQQECHDYVLLSARGTHEPQGPSVGFVGMLNETFATVPNGVAYNVVYPATSNLTGAAEGVADIIRYISAGVVSCPQQKYALLGYSQGASVVDISLHNFTDRSSAAYNAIRGVVVIGNPGQVSGKTANVDENGGDTTRNFTGSYFLGGAGAIPDDFYSDDKVLDICFQGDLICALPPNGTRRVVQSHLLYGSTPRVQEMGADFLIRKLEQDGTPSGVSSGAVARTTTTSATTGASAVVSTTMTSSPTQTTAAASATSTGVAATVRPLELGTIFTTAATCMMVLLGSYIL